MASFDETADALYALPPADFTAARDDAVKAARADGDRALAGRLGLLRKPTVTAWLVNLLVREQRETVDAFVELGAQLREAQQDLQASELRELNRQRQQMVSAIAQQARRLGTQAGARITDETLREVEATLGAALAQPEQAVIVQQGRLRTGLSYSGLGGPTTAAPPAPAAPVAPKPAGSTATAVVERDRAAKAAREAAARREAEREEAREAARRAALAAAVTSAQRELDAADLRHANAERAAEDSTAAHEAAQERVQQLQAELIAAQDALREATRAATSRQRELTAAAAVAEQAQRAWETAQEALAADL